MDFDLVESSCEICKNIFYTRYIPELEGSRIVEPEYCPFCGTKLTTKNGEIRNDIR